MSASQKQAEGIVAQNINHNTPGIMAFEAACLLLEIEAGEAPATIQRRPIFQKINQFAKKNGPHGEWRVRDFLKEFLKTHAPGWDYREEALQGGTEDRKYQQESERIAKEIAEDERLSLALFSKFHTPDAPDAIRLRALAWEVRHRKPSPEGFKQFGWSAWKHWQVIRETWPTLRELKMATAIPERVIEKIIKNLRPQKNETTKEPRIIPLVFDPSRGKSVRRGAVPWRYGPRLVIGVLNEFVNRLREFRIDEGERNQLRKTALLVKRAFVARLNRSRLMV
jgi:hypothetical protein